MPPSRATACLVLSAVVAAAETYLELGAVPPLGARTKMRWTPPPGDDDGVDYFQLFLPRRWRADAAKLYPVLVFLHGAGDGIWEVMNSQSLPRLLAADQSTAFDPRKTWSFDFGGRRYENATFADDFPFICIMPQGWDGSQRPGWSHARLSRVRKLATDVAAAYHGDPDRTSLTGQSAGGIGAWQFAVQFPDFLSALVPVCGAILGSRRVSDDAARRLAGLPIWVYHAVDDVAMPVFLADRAVSSMNQAPQRTTPVRFTRYDHAPAPPDPQYSGMTGHASYDLAYRSAELYAWLLRQRRGEAA
mmetsp:Transcript_19066/g.58684  ORF Transcript_19066/g.58684 Transcript_19066/m.58684 type:complete len:303 (+) Transcript_19066:1059-1967(+)